MWKWLRKLSDRRLGPKHEGWTVETVVEFAHFDVKCISATCKRISLKGSVFCEGCLYDDEPHELVRFEVRDLSDMHRRMRVIAASTETLISLTNWGFSKLTVSFIAGFQQLLVGTGAHEG